MGDITKNFSYSEFSHSNTALKNEWDNSIPENLKPNIVRLCTSLLQPIIDATGWSCIISSGYRSERLNKAVKGSSTSHHRTASAADCNFYKISNGKSVKVSNVEVVEKVKELGVPFTQMISYNKKGFVHLSFNGVPKMQVLVDDPTDGADVQDKFPTNEQIPSYSLAVVPDLNSGQDIPYDTVLEWLKKSYVNVDKIEDFLSFTDGNESNFDRIKALYNPEEIVKYKDDLDSGSTPVVKYGTKLLVPTDYLTAVVQKLENSDLFMVPKEGGYSAFWEEGIKRLTENDGYVSAVDLGDGVAQQRNLNARIWIYSNSQKRIFDVTPFIVALQTNKQLKSGSFSIELSPINNDSAVPEFDIINQFRNFLAEYQGSEGDSKSAVGVVNRKRIIDWFSATFRMNDMVFIRFEELQVTKNKYFQENYNLRIPYDRLSKDLVWDMIGFIDNVNSSVNFDSNSYTVNISGRDFTKILQDDGCYFVFPEFIFGAPNNFMVLQDESAFIKRNIASGDFIELASFQTIKSLTSFIFNALSSIQVLEPDNVLHASDRRNEVENNEVEYKTSGIWRIFKAFVDPQLEDRVIVDSSMVNPEGTLHDFMNKICQEPFVEWFVDTWGSGVDLIIRKPPFDKSSILNAIDGFNSSKPEKIDAYHVIEPKDIFSMNLSFDERAYSWYRITANSSILSGVDEAISLTKLPIFYLDQFVKLFGNKRYQVSDNYIHSSYMGGEQSSEKLGKTMQKIVSDFLFVIESTFYLPFSRKGTIVVNGDRRIKVGSFVKLEPTNEIFYVTGVSQEISFGDSLSRQTTISVERGLCIDCLDGTNSYNYFKILNFEEIKKQLNEKVSGGKSEGVQVTDMVDIDNFYYFLDKSQWVRQTGLAYTEGPEIDKISTMENIG